MTRKLAGRWTRKMSLVAAMSAGVLGLAACGGGAASTGSSSSSGHASHGAAVTGGTATMAEGAQGTPNYIFPLEAAEYLTVANSWLQDLMWRPLYWFGGKTNTDVSLNEADSLAQPPVYTNGGKTVTINLKHNYKWSDGHPVTSRDVIFYMNLIKANKDQYGAYTAGAFPDNVTSYKAEGPYKVVLQLNRSYNENWFTDDELGLVVPFPQHAWDKTSASGAVGNYDTTTGGARRVFDFITSQAKETATYSRNPLWKVVDGPWLLQRFENTGYASFIPNPKYSGPVKPHLSRFVMEPFTTDTAQFDDLIGGHLDVGYLPSEDLARESSLTSSGYTPVRTSLFQTNFIALNFNNPSVGPIIKQLYFRQALQHLMDQKGGVQKILHGIGGYPVYGPIPPEPNNPYIRAAGNTDLYPFSISTARQLLTSHGWKIPASGPATCAKPGTGSGECGAGIPAGKKLVFNFLSTSGSSYLTEQMDVYNSDAAKAGIVFHITSEPFNSVIAQTLPCKPSQALCKWQIGTWGAGFAWSYPPYPTGELLFATGAPDNENYSSPTADRLIKDTLYTNSPSALTDYARYIAKQLPVIWQMATYNINAVSNKLHGVVFNAVGGINPENWYYTK